MDRELQGKIEALLFVAGDPISARKISEIVEADEQQVCLLLKQLKEDMEQPQRGLTLIEVGGGWQLVTKSVFNPVIEKLYGTTQHVLSQAALETLAIIAFRQPVTRVEIEQYRGVKSDSALNTLLERGLIQETGRKEVMGRPILYGTTKIFFAKLWVKKFRRLTQFG